MAIYSAVRRPEIKESSASTENQRSLDGYVTMGLLQKYVLGGMSRNDVIKDAIKKVRDLADVESGHIIMRSRNLAPIALPST